MGVPSFGLSVNINTTIDQLKKIYGKMKNKDKAESIDRDIDYFFKQVSAVVNEYGSKNNDQVKKYLFSYLRYINKTILASTAIRKSHPEHIETLNSLRLFVLDEIMNVGENPSGVYDSVVD